MLPEVCAGAHHAGELLLRQVRGAPTRGIHRFRDVGGLAVEHAELLPLLGIAYDDEGPILGVAAGGSANRRIEDFGDQRVRHRIRFEAAQGSRRIDRLEEAEFLHRQPTSAQIDRVAFEQLERDDLQGRFMRCR
jgi:hypothetical protein